MFKADNWQMEKTMFQKALAARPDVGNSVLWTPFVKTVRQTTNRPSALSGSPASACLSSEDDFELTGDFLTVFTGASERIAGFFVGCTVVAVMWAAFSIL